jgi:acyl-CoA thioester hydrolase
MTIRNCFFRQDGVMSVRLTSTVGWLDLDQRRLKAPPELLFDVIRNIPKADDFVELPSSIKQ